MQLNGGQAFLPVSEAKPKSTGKNAYPPFDSTFYSPMLETETRRRHLPHWQQGQVWCFVTWRLKDSLPQNKLGQLSDEKAAWIKFNPEPWDEATANEYHRIFTDKIDEWLDQGSGACVLRDPENARIVADALRHFDGQRYDLASFVVMPNHVHVLFRPCGEHTISDILKTWKGFTAREINKRMKTQGSLWQSESWDRLVRNEQHFFKCMQYIRDNPHNFNGGQAFLPVSEASANGGQAFLPVSEAKPESTGKNACPPLFLLTIACALGILGCGKAPEPPLLGASRLVFTAENGTNAFNHVKGLVENCTPRDAMTPGAECAAEWIQARLANDGVIATLDRFTSDTPNGKRDFVNVMADLPGETREVVVLLSHFDTKSGISEDFQGANDGGSSTGLLIELARIISSQRLSTKYNILFAFTDGEECRVRYGPNDGLHGSKHLAAKLKREGVKVKAVILVDMIGDRDLNIMVPRNGTGWLRALALKAADAAGCRDYISLCDGDILDDHQPFLDAGFPAVDLIDFTYGSAPGQNDYWHTPEDTLDKISPESLTITGKILVEMLNQL